jgi:tRNA/tmRNA/rRNA uracil-C5-methylase (TrmA/RlmC/RlmD family)
MEKNNAKRSIKLRGVENVSEAIEALTEAARNNNVDVAAAFMYNAPLKVDPK